MSSSIWATVAISGSNTSNSSSITTHSRRWRGGAGTTAAGWVQTWALQYYALVVQAPLLPGLRKENAQQNEGSSVLGSSCRDVQMILF